MPYTIEFFEATKENIPSKPIVITEAGWPTHSNLEDDYTNIEVQKAYIAGLEAWAKKKRKHLNPTTLKHLTNRGKVQGLMPNLKNTGDYLKLIGLKNKP